MSKTSAGIFRGFCKKLYGKLLCRALAPVSLHPRQYGVDNPDFPYFLKVNPNPLIVIGKSKNKAYIFYHLGAHFF